MAKYDVLIVVAILLIRRCHGYGSGAPGSQCGSLVPGHGLSAQENTNAPFTVKLNSTVLTSGGSVEVELTHVGSGEAFKGYMIQARKEVDDSILGSFETISGDAKYLTCDSLVQSTVTHKTSAAKKSVNVKWKAPSNFQGNVIILSTFVKDYSTYWVKLPSEKLTVSASGEQSAPEPESESEPSPVSEPEPESEAEPEPEPEGGAEPKPNLSQSLRSMYNGCGSSKSCFGVPDKCLNQKNCQLLASWKRSGENFEFELYREKGSGNYVALGLSEDSSMGNELVLACGHKSRAEVYWNSGKTKPTPTDLEKGSGVLGYKFSSENGGISCTIKSAGLLNYDGHEADLLNKKFAILLAGGPYAGAGSLGYHTIKNAAAEAVDLAEISNAGAKSDLLLKLHGLFMLMAWIGCAGAGMIMARYFKQTWKGKQIFGADRWFQAHRLFMVSTVIFSAAGLVVIIIQVKFAPFSTLDINAHPAIGLVCVILAFLQPIMAAFRPHPGDDGRKIFNWAHWGVGSAAHAFGICAIFLVGDLAAAKLTNVEWWSWVLLAFVIFHVITHVIYSLLWAKNERSPQKVTDHQMSAMNNATKIHNNNFATDEKLDQDQEGGSLRKFLFLIYFATAWVLVVVLSWAVFSAES